MNICAPHVVIDSQVPTCLTKEALIRIANNYNKKKKEEIIINSKMNKDEIWHAINKVMKNVCKQGDEICWIEYTKSSEYLVNTYYKPPRPSGKYAWLSTIDIDNILHQYEQRYPGFVFVGAIPRDFFNILSEFGLQDMRKLSKKGKIFGIVFNTDDHTKSGQHWVSIIINLNDKTVEFFDSTGNPPLREIKELINQIIKNTYDKYEVKLVKKINKIQHQKRNSECGTYAIYFITERLKGRSFEDITQDIKRDDVMNGYRDVFFRP